MTFFPRDIMGLFKKLARTIRDACDEYLEESEESEEKITETEEPDTTENTKEPEETKENNEKENIEEDPYKKGKIFEDYALCLFPQRSFNIIHKTVGGADLEGRYTEDCVNPDYKFRDLKTKQEFWVECKYRSRRGAKGVLEWTDYKHLQRYKAIQKESKIPIYILVGVGGEPDSPEELLFFKLDDLPYYSLYYSVQKEITIESKPYDCLDDMICKKKPSE